MSGPDEDPQLPSLGDALSELMQAAAHMHELYSSLIEAGFDRKEALYLVAQMARSGGGDTTGS